LSIDTDVHKLLFSGRHRPRASITCPPGRISALYSTAALESGVSRFSKLCSLRLRPQGNPHGCITSLELFR
jgi:hypothetical protein